jgi:hypothetical protein
MKKTAGCLKGYEIINPYCTYQQALKLLQENQFDRLAFDYWGGTNDKIHPLASFVISADKEGETFVVVQKKVQNEE